MRSNLSTVFQVLAVASGIAVIAFTGCSSTGSYKMPGADMFSWGKKKPADTSVAASSRSNLPAPPSSIATPQTPPSYTAPPASGYSQERLATAPATPSGPIGQPSGNPYASTGHPAPTGTSQGFYSQDYTQSGGSHPPYGGGSAAPSPYLQAGPASGGAAWSSNATPQYAPPPTGYGSAFPQSNYSPPEGYGQTAALPSNSHAAPPSTGHPNQTFPSGQYGHSSQGSSIYSAPDSGAAYSVPPAEMQAWQGGEFSEPYRPGSTGRPTPSSDALRVAEGPGIQPASFSGAGSQYAPAQPPGSYYPPGSPPATTMPDGSSYSSPSVYR
jgi:hypothetical protein